ncbi:MAG: hypothetical protein JRG73_17810 [Deltaproteobacteria bacterium]|nr:hypothetical protein [Deltaproteobacteria bacterium]MBW2308782.1 hypothetical protein [Deltaproteobacteria bacterium]
MVRHLQFDKSMKQKIAVFQLNERVAPRCDYAGEMVVATVAEDGAIVERKTLHFPRLDSQGLANLLHREKVGVVICGGIKQDTQAALKKLHIRWIDNVIGSIENVLRHYARGDLEGGKIVD